MFCPKCGRELPSGVTFCDKCGANLVPNNSTEKKGDSSLPLALLLTAVIVIISLFSAFAFFHIKLSESRKIEDAKIAREEAVHNNNNTVKKAEDAPTEKEEEKEIEKEDDEKKDNTFSERESIKEQSPVPENLILSMSKEEKRSINIFFSNFTEAFFSHYDKNSSTDFDLICFAFIHNMINNSNETIYRNDKMGISYENINKTLDKYLGAKVPPKNAVGTYSTWEFYDGVFWTVVSDGESHDYFAVVNDMYDMGDGLFRVSYDAFYAGYDELTDEHYSYTSDEAYKGCEYEYTAYAVIKKKTYNGKKTYELVSLSRDEL